MDDTADSTIRARLLAHSFIVTEPGGSIEIACATDSYPYFGSYVLQTKDEFDQALEALIEAGTVAGFC